MEPPVSARARWIAVFALAAAVLAVFWPVLGHDFLAYDDEKYVTRNRHVQMGSPRTACVGHKPRSAPPTGIR